WTESSGSVLLGPPRTHETQLSKVERRSRRGCSIRRIHRHWGYRSNQPPRAESPSGVLEPSEYSAFLKGLASSAWAELQNWQLSARSIFPITLVSWTRI